MVIVFEELLYDIPQLGLAGQNQAVETFGFYGLDERFNIPVIFRHPGWYQLCLATGRFQDIGEFSEKQRVAVMDDVLHSIELPIEGIGLVAGNLRGPVRIRIAGDATQPDFPGGEIFKEEDGLTDEPVGRQMSMLTITQVPNNVNFAETAKTLNLKISHPIIFRIYVKPSISGSMRCSDWSHTLEITSGSPHSEKSKDCRRSDGGASLCEEHRGYGRLDTQIYQLPLLYANGG